MSEMIEILRLDARGLQCPLPVLKTKKALRGMAPGERIEVLATDAASVRDFDAFTRKYGHQLLRGTQSSGLYRFLIQKGTSTVHGVVTKWSQGRDQSLDS